MEYLVLGAYLYYYITYVNSFRTSYQVFTS